MRSCHLQERFVYLSKTAPGMLLCYGGGIPESPGSNELGSVRSLSHKVVWAQLQFTVTFKWEHMGSGTSSTKEHK